jgi:opacity protein-like surface antigen
VKRLGIAAASILIMCAAASAGRYALLVGSRDGGRGYARLKYVDRDIARMRAILMNHCGFDPDRILVIRNKRPEAVTRAFTSLNKRLATDSAELFLLYYTGHADRNALLIEGAAFELRDVKAAVNAIRSPMKISIFDACQSGSFARLKGGALAEPFLYAPKQQTTGRVVLYSSSASEHSQESDTYEGSVFTFHLVNALRGAADVSGDGRVTLNEAYQYAYHNTVSSTAYSAGGVQHPGYLFRIHGEGDIVLARLGRNAGGLLLERGMSGRVAVIDARGAVMAEFAKESGGRTGLSLPPGTYTIVVHRGDYAERAEVAVGKGMTPVGADSFRRVRSYASQVKGRRVIGPVLAVGIEGGYGTYDREDISSRARGQFQGLSSLSLNPAMSFDPGAILGGAIIDFWLPNGLCWAIRGEYTAIAGGGASASVRANPYDTLGYRTAFEADVAFRLGSVYAGGGYRFRRGLARFFDIMAGLELAAGIVRVTEYFADDLFDIAYTHRFEQTVSAFGISGGVGCQIPVSPHLAVGASVRYRHQLRQLSEDGPFDTPFDGVRAAISACYAVDFR